MKDDNRFTTKTLPLDCVMIFKDGIEFATIQTSNPKHAAQIVAALNRKPSGRKPKYATDEERRAARLAAWAKQNKKRQNKRG